MTIPFARTRISSIDLLRGIIMVIMALDHVRDYFHVDAQLFNATDLTKTYPSLFFTRWITHFCAPTFALLAGTSICISLQRKSRKEVSGYLVTRGLWLVFAELVILRFGMLFNFYYDITFLTVLWMLGMSMVLLAGLIRMKEWVIPVLAVAIFFGHNALDFVVADPASGWSLPWNVLMRSAFIPLSEGHSVIIAYPVIPWFGIVLMGYCLGWIYSPAIHGPTRKRRLILWGLAAMGGFLVLRTFNIYGDPNPWTSQGSGIFTILSFLNCTKNPVSLLFSLMTLGPAILALGLIEPSAKPSSLDSNPAHWVSRFFLTFGRVPFFFFIVHFFVIHMAALATTMIIAGKSLTEIDFHFNKSFGGISAGVGVGLFWVYVIWLSVVLLLYPLCRWFDGVKTMQPRRWLTYL